MTIAQLVDQLEARVRAAKDVPLLGGVRLDRDELYDLIDQMRDIVGTYERIDEDRVVFRGEGLIIPLDELDDVIHNAKTVPLTDQVRLDREATLEVIARVRRGAAQDRIATRSEAEAHRDASAGRTPDVLDQLERLVRGAKPVPLTTWVRLERAAAARLIDNLRAYAPGALMRHVDAFEDLIHRAPPVPLTEEVRVERDEVLTIIQQMRAAFPQGTPPAPTN